MEEAKNKLFHEHNNYSFKRVKLIFNLDTKVHKTHIKISFRI